MNTINAMKQASASMAIYQSKWNATRFDDVILGLNEAIAREEAQTVEPDWYHAECDDPDYSGFHQELGDAETQISEHGGYITELFTRPAPPPSGERKALIVEENVARRNLAAKLRTITSNKQDDVFIHRSADMLAADALQPPAPISKPLPLTDELRKFLNGEGPLDGAWFGDLHPMRKGKFWWREFLPAAAHGIKEPS